MKLIQLQAQSSLPKYKQIVRSIEIAIQEKRLQKNDHLPSINKISLEHGISRDTVLLAFDELKKRGIVYSRLGKGYFVKSTESQVEMRIFLLFDELNAFKEELYLSFLDQIGDNAQVDIFFHHFNENLFQKMVNDSNGNYSKYIIMPSNLKQVSSCIKQLPREDVYILDQTNEQLKELPSVHQHFEKDIFRALEKGMHLLQKYNRFILIFPGEKEPEGMVIGFRTFCEKHQLNYKIIPDFENKIIEKGAVFVIPSDLHLVQVIEQGKSQQLNLGTDYGIISFNEMPLKKVVENGITTISTDFKKMGTTLAKMVLSNEKKQIENPSDLIIRNSL